MEQINLFIHIQNADKEQNINAKLFRFEAFLRTKLEALPGG